MLGSIAGVFGGIANSAANQAISLYGNRKMMQYQYKYWKKSQLNGPSYQREGLEKAGYNPLLALNGGSAASMTPTATPIPAQDYVGSAQQGSNMMNEIMEKFKLDKDKTKAETKRLDSERRIREMESLFQIEKLKTDMELERSQMRKNYIDSGGSIWDRAFDNPLVAPLAGVFGYKAAEKLTGIFGGSAKGKAPIVKAWEKAAKKGSLFIGSKLLRGISLPLLIGTAGVAGWHAAKDGKGKKLSEDKYFSHGNWSR